MSVNVKAAQADTVYIYTDASFSKSHEIAIIGFACFSSTLEHESVPLMDIGITLSQVNEGNNIRAELRGAIAALEACLIACPKREQVILYTDCQNIIGLPERREKLERTSYISQSKNKPLANTDLYQEFYSLCDQINPQLIWIKGHTSVANYSTESTKNRIQKNFSYLDKEVRKFLRTTISEI
jgi:ribonuclease HI